MLPLKIFVLGVLHVQSVCGACVHTCTRVYGTVEWAFFFFFLIEENRVLFGLICFGNLDVEEGTWLHLWRWLAPDNGSFLVPDLGKEEANSQWSQSCSKWSSPGESQGEGSSHLLDAFSVPSAHTLIHLNLIEVLGNKCDCPQYVYRWGNILELWGVHQLAWSQTAIKKQRS